MHMGVRSNKIVNTRVHQLHDHPLSQLLDEAFILRLYPSRYLPDTAPKADLSINTDLSVEESKSNYAPRPV